MSTCVRYMDIDDILRNICLYQSVGNKIINPLRGLDDEVLSKLYKLWEDHSVQRRLDTGHKPESGLKLESGNQRINWIKW
jgi:hypothetical protein